MNTIEAVFFSSFYVVHLDYRCTLRVMVIGMLTKTLWGILLSAHIVASEDYHDTLDFVFEDLSKSQLKDFLHCILDEVPCSENFASYKQLYPTFLHEFCSRCSKCQKYQLYVFWNRVRNELPDTDWKEYRARFDPENKYIDKIYTILLAEKDESYC